MLKFLQQIAEKKQVEASEAYSRASLSRNRRLPARYRSNEVSMKLRMTTRRRRRRRRKLGSLTPFPHILQKKSDKRKDATKEKEEPKQPGLFDLFGANRGWPAIPRPSTDTRPSADGLGPRLAPNRSYPYHLLLHLLRGGLEPLLDLHPARLLPLASWRAVFLAAQASARAPCGPPQLAHLIALCGHGWPRRTWHPSMVHQ